MRFSINTSCDVNTFFVSLQIMYTRLLMKLALPAATLVTCTTYPGRSDRPLTVFIPRLFRDQLYNTSLHNRTTDHNYYTPFVTFVNLLMFYRIILCLVFESRAQRIFKFYARKFKIVFARLRRVSACAQSRQLSSYNINS